MVDWLYWLYWFFLLVLGRFFVIPGLSWRGCPPVPSAAPWPRRPALWPGVAAVCFFIAFPASRSFSPVAPRNVRASKLITPLLLLRRPPL